jgi:hypothetical protein
MFLGVCSDIQIDIFKYLPQCSMVILKNFKMERHVEDVIDAAIKNVNPLDLYFQTMSDYNKVSLLTALENVGCSLPLVIDKHPETEILVFCNYAIREENIELLEWLRQHDYRWLKYICHFAIAYGYLHILIWVRNSTGYSLTLYDENLCTIAATMGFLEILEWLHDNGFKYDKNNILESAKNEEIKDYVERYM